MSPTDKGSTPESSGVPEPTGGPTPGEAAPVEPTAHTSDTGVDLTKHDAEASHAGTPGPSTPASGSPIGGDYPPAESFASANGPAGKNKKTIAIIAGLVVAVVIAAVAVLLFFLLKDDSESPEAQIKQVTQEFFDAQNSGKLSDIVPLVCEKVAATAPADLPDQAPSTPQVQIDQFDEVSVDGDTATAMLTVSAIDDPEMPTQQIPMMYVNEDGWKLCE